MESLPSQGLTPSSAQGFEHAAKATARTATERLESGPVDPFAFDPRLERVRTYFLRRIAEPFTLQMAAQLACLEPHYFCTLFSRSIGIGFSEWRTMCRIAHAAELLRTRRISIAGASRAVGYSDTSSFSRAFRRAKGMSPRCFLRQVVSARAVATLLARPRS